MHGEGEGLRRLARVKGQGVDLTWWIRKEVVPLDFPLSGTLGLKDM